jgi:hypothetical protein
MFYACIEGFGSNIGRDIGYRDRVFMAFLSPSRKIPGLVVRLGYRRRPSFKSFQIHQSCYHSIPTAVVKQATARVSFVWFCSRHQQCTIKHCVGNGLFQNTYLPQGASFVMIRVSGWFKVKIRTFLQLVLNKIQKPGLSQTNRDTAGLHDEILWKIKTYYEQNSRLYFLSN